MSPGLPRTTRATISANARVVVIGASTGGRAHPRIGNRHLDEAEMESAYTVDAAALSSLGVEPPEGPLRALI